MIVWIVGHLYPEDGDEAWGFSGVFSTEEKAIAACATHRYFVGPATLDAVISPDVSKAWPGAYLPHVSPRVRA